jgi:hypothetical protein
LSRAHQTSGFVVIAMKMFWVVVGVLGVAAAAPPNEETPSSVAVAAPAAAATVPCPEQCYKKYQVCLAQTNIIDFWGAPKSIRSPNSE